MPLQLLRKRAIALLTILVVCLGFLAYWFFLRDRGGPQIVALPTSEIRFLNREERLRRDIPAIPSANVVVFPTPQLLAEQVDNPVLFSDRFVVTRVQNGTAQPLQVYDLGLSLETNRNVRHAFIVNVDAYDSNGKALEKIDPDLVMYISTNEPTVPTADVLLSRHPQTFTLQPNEAIELPMTLFGAPRLLKPGTYTVRATVSYAEAPSGETKRITCEPVSITVTEDHIKAAKAHWASAKN